MLLEDFPLRTELGSVWAEMKASLIGRIKVPLGPLWTMNNLGAVVHKRWSSEWACGLSLHFNKAFSRYLNPTRLSKMSTLIFPSVLPERINYGKREKYLWGEWSSYGWFEIEFLLSHPGQLLASLQQGAFVLMSSLPCSRYSMKGFWQRAQAGTQLRMVRNGAFSVTNL